MKCKKFAWCGDAWVEQALHVVLQSSECRRQGLACNDPATAGDFTGCLSGEDPDVGSDVNDCVPFCQGDAMLEVAALFFDLSAEECYIGFAHICNVFAIVVHGLAFAQGCTNAPALALSVWWMADPSCWQSLLHQVQVAVLTDGKRHLQM